MIGVLNCIDDFGGGNFFCWIVYYELVVFFGDWRGNNSDWRGGLWCEGMFVDLLFYGV